ncbi:MAG: glutaredoxin family protein [Chloroflexota bacterium]
MLVVTLYTRKDCRLCEQARADLDALQDKHPHRLAEVDIDSDPALQRAYLLEIPVVEVGPYLLKAPFDRQKLAMTLGAASDRRGQLEQLGGETYEARVRRGQVISGADKVMFWISRHYLLMLNLFILLYVGLPFLAPIFMKAGAPIPARVVYTAYSPLCHQFGFRSFFLFGEQAFYPLKEAGVSGVVDFETATGLQGLHDPNAYSRLQARQYVGNETVGYKVALCQRDVAIYAAILSFGLLFGLTGRRWPQLHWLAWIALAFGPIGLDGFSQLFSQFDLRALASILPYRESTPYLRVLTGAMFGFFTAWFAYPSIEESMSETRQFFLKKFAVVKTAEA